MTAIIIFLALAIVGTGYISINGERMNFNWFAFIALIIFLVKYVFLII